MPEYVGGEEALREYLNKNIRYPEKAKEKRLKLFVSIRFCVNDDGSVSDPMPMSLSGYGFEEEAIRLIMGMPKWIPGKQNGKAVNVIYQLPIYFSPDEKDNAQPKLGLFTVVDQYPEYAGGQAALMQYFESKKLYVDNSFSVGSIEIRFSISTEGKPEQLKIITNASPKIQRRITEAINTMPVWKAGKRNGQAVATELRYRLVTKKPKQKA